MSHRPSSPIKNGGDIGSATHRFKIFRVFFLIDILRFVNFQKKVRGIADDIGVFVSREKMARALPKRTIFPCSPSHRPSKPLPRRRSIRRVMESTVCGLNVGEHLSGST